MTQSKTKQPEREKKHVKQFGILDKLDSDLMWWFYDMIELHFDCKTIAIDSTDVREMIKRALQAQADKSYEQGRSECPCLDKYKLTKKK